MATAHLTWTVGGGLQQDVKYRKEGEVSFTLYQTVAGSVTEIDIPGLDENEVYEFVVVNKCGFGQEISSAAIGAAFVTCPALSVEQLALDLIVSFDELGGDIDLYTVRCYELPGETLVGEFPYIATGSGTVPIQFAGLTPDTYYKIRVIPSIDGVYENATCEIEERTLGCSGGYTLAPDGSYCYLIEETAADAPTGGTPESTVAATEDVYSSVGSYIYDPGYATTGVGTWTQIPLSNGFWVNGPGDGGNHTTTDGPLNRSGLWTTSELSNQDIGFAVCIDLTDSSTYYIGIGGDNKCRIMIDGAVIVDQDVAAIGAATTWSSAATFKIWHIYPVTLSAGPHTIELIGHNDGGAAALGAEIYHNTDAEIMAATSYVDLNLIFSTKDYRGQPVQLGSDDLGYTCPTGYSLATCEEPVVCRRILTTLPT
jgi:hypothetical protein